MRACVVKCTCLVSVVLYKKLLWFEPGLSEKECNLLSVVV